MLSEMKYEIKSGIYLKINQINFSIPRRINKRQAGFSSIVKFMFSLNVGVQPIVLRHRRPLPININSEAMSTFFLMCSGFVSYHSNVHG